jgi:formylglycine-generating enzyme required for sulfatase activity
MIHLRRLGAFGFGLGFWVLAAASSLCGEPAVEGDKEGSAAFQRGDADAGGTLNLTDAVFTLSFLFCAGPAPRCLDAADADDNGAIQITDAIYTLNHLFLGGPPLPAPGGACGPDPTEDGLGCRQFAGCSAGPFVAILPGGVPLEMVWCPPGTFLMGRYPGEQVCPGDAAGSREVPQHEVTLTRGFHLGKYEVTKRQWQALMGTTPWAGQRPVLDDPESAAVYLSWNDAQAFVAAMNALGQGTFSLPTEAQWEHACRAGTTTRFYWGDDPEEVQVGSNAVCGVDHADVVGLKLPNAWGLYDMSGNAWEYCQDWWAHWYPEGAVTDPTGPASGSEIVKRSGYCSSQACHIRSAVRDWGWPDDPMFNYGFRLARQ